MPKTSSYEPYPGFIIRIPVFPLDYISIIPCEGDLSGFVLDHWKNPLVRDAVLLASPDLFFQIENGCRKNKLSPGLIQAFTRYFLRMSFRCTPFGLFAGVGDGSVAGQNSLKPHDPGKFLLKCRLDMEFLGSFVSSLIRQRELRRFFKYSRNSSIYKLGTAWRYVEVKHGNETGKKYSITSIDRNPILDCIVETSDTYRSWLEIKAQLLSNGYDQLESDGFIHDLVDSQILVPDIYPSLTGRDFNNKLIARLGESVSLSSTAEKFLELSHKVSSITVPGTFNKEIDKVYALAREAGAGFNPSHLVQADLYTSFYKSGLSRDTINKVLLGIRILRSLAIKSRNHYLEDFKKYFLLRFGTSEVPLPLVMDTEFGIGLTGPEGQQMADPAPLTDGLDFPVSGYNPGQREPNPLLLEKFISFKPEEGNYILLEREDLARLKISEGYWPDQLFAICRLAGEEQNPEILVDLAAPGNPSRLLSRFGTLPIKGLSDQIRQLISDDVNYHPDHILADIAHLPEDRAGNILQRQSYFDYEIPYLASAGGDAEIVRPEDINVTVTGDKVILKHSQTGKRILPRLTTAHNYRIGQLPLYQFLAEVAHQDESETFLPGWGWLGNRNGFLPGIRLSNIILSRPKWRLSIPRELRGIRKDEGKVYHKIMSWVNKNSLPVKSVWVQGENEMFIDWSSKSIVSAAWNSIRKNNIATFTDYPYNNGSPVHSNAGSFANEVIISFKKKKP